MSSTLFKFVKSLPPTRRSFSITSIRWMKEGDGASLVRKITSQDLRVFGDLVGDTNPVHFPGDHGGDEQDAIVHGTLLIGLVSGLMASSVPGPGTVLTNLTVKFVKPCPCNITVEVKVVLGRVRKVTKATFMVTNLEKGEVVLEGEVSCFLSKQQLLQGRS